MGTPNLQVWHPFVTAGRSLFEGDASHALWSHHGIQLLTVSPPTTTSHSGEHLKATQYVLEQFHRKSSGIEDKNGLPWRHVIVSIICGHVEKTNR